MSDFGLAKRMEGPSKVTLTDAVLGSPSYMAPEQASGKSSQATTAVDVYSLGAILYELLTGQPPFHAETPLATLQQVVAQEPRRPTAIKARASRELETISLKCLEKSPERRYDSAAALAEDLERWLRKEPIQARPAAPVERVAKWVHRNPKVAMLAVLLMVVGALGVSGILWMSLRATTNARESHERLVRMHVATGNRLVEQNDPFQGLLWLVEALRLERGGALREENHRHRVEAVLRHSPRLEQLLFHSNWVMTAAFSPDGRRLLTGSSDHTARVWDANTGQLLLPPLPHDGAVESARFSSDGKRIVTMDDAGVARVWNADTGAAITPPLKADDFDSNPLEDAKKLLVFACFSPDERRILTAWGSKSAHLWDAVSGRHLMALPHDTVVHHAAFSSDGQHIVTSSSDKTARVWDARSGQLAAAPLEHHHFVAWAQFSPDGQRLLTVSDRMKVHLWDWSGGHELTPPLTHGIVLFHASFSPDGRHVLTASWDKTARIWDAATGLGVAAFHHSGGLWAAAWSPNGSQIATAGYNGVALVWDVSRSDRATCALPVGSPVASVAFSPDGRRLAVASWNGTVHLWNLVADDSSVQTFQQLVGRHGKQG